MSRRGPSQKSPRLRHEPAVPSIRTKGIIPLGPYKIPYNVPTMRRRPYKHFYWSFSPQGYSGRSRSLGYWIEALHAIWL